MIIIMIVITIFIHGEISHKLVFRTALLIHNTPHPIYINILTLLWGSEALGSLNSQKEALIQRKQHKM